MLPGLQEIEHGDGVIHVLFMRRVRQGQAGGLIARTGQGHGGFRVLRLLLGLLHQLRGGGAAEHHREGDVRVVDAPESQGRDAAGGVGLQEVGVITDGTAHGTGPGQGQRLLLAVHGHLRLEGGGQRQVHVGERLGSLYRLGL